MKNKYGVPYHCYELTFINGETKYIDIGCEEDWGNIQEMWVDDGYGKLDACVGWGNDEDGHIQIVKVIDMETNESLNVIDWAEEVWDYVDNYSS